jgi:hypothetical protein
MLFPLGFVAVKKLLPKNYQDNIGQTLRSTQKKLSESLTNSIGPGQLDKLLTRTRTGAHVPKLPLALGILMQMRIILVRIGWVMLGSQVLTHML